MKKALLLFLVITFGVMTNSWSQLAKIKSVFLLNFAKNTGWPDSGSQGSTFVITVIGDKEISTELEALAKIKQINGKTLVVNRVKQLKEIEPSQIIFLGSSKSSLMSSLNSNQKNNPVLLISDKKGLYSKGAGICFIVVNGKLRFEIKPENIERRGLSVSSKLISLGIKK
jgi:hypothetical protein